MYVYVLFLFLLLGACSSSVDPSNNMMNDYSWTLLRQEALNGVPSAQNTLGELLFEGRGIERDSEAAVEWFMRSAEKGDNNAEYNLGLAYENGLGVAEDLDIALNWYKKSSKSGNEKAQLRLAEYYRSNKKYSLAAEEYNKLANNSNALAEFRLGEFYKDGKGVKKDLKNRCIGII